MEPGFREDDTHAELALSGESRNQFIWVFSSSLFLHSMQMNFGYSSVANVAQPV